MFTVGRTVPVNGGGAGEPRLSRAAVWRGLVMKAENAVPFVEAMGSCTVVERGENWLVRDIVLRGEPMRERVTFEPERRVTFERLESSAMGTIVNEIVEDAGELALRFTFSLEVAGLAPGSAEEKAFADTMAESYLKAVDTTLAAIRQKLATGELAI